MAQSLSNVLVHFVFSTKQRTPWLDDKWRHELHGYIGGITQRLGGTAVIINSVQDHVHMLVPLPRTCSISELMKEVKGGSSTWIHEKFPHLATLQWQGGYAAFSVSASQKETVVKYISNQEEHHRKFSFQDELRRLLDAYEVTYDEAYLWD